MFPLRSDGTITTDALEVVTVSFLPGRLCEARETKSLARSNDAMISARVVSVFPSPISSARMPPMKSLADLLLAPVTECW